MDVKYLPINSLRPYEKNPRKNDEAVDSVIKSISDFGWRVPIIINNDNVIIAGHTRYKAAKKMKIKEVPCIVADDLSEEQVKAFRLADNKTQELASWDFAKLIDELNLFAEDYDTVPLGFESLIKDDYDESGDDDEAGGGRHEREEASQDLDFGEELDLDKFDDEQFKCTCPFCGFKFNDE